MKHFFIVFFFILTISVQYCFAADDMTDLDYEFIDNAFSNPNPTTNKQFEEVMKRYENKEPNGIFYKIKKFFNRDNPEYDKKKKKMYEAPNNQPLRIKDAPENKPYVTIGANFYDSKDNMIQAGHYQADYKEENGSYTITLLQGTTRIVDIKAIPYEDDWEAPAVIYCRTEKVQDDLIRIIYSNLDLTIQGYIRLNKE